MPTVILRSLAGRVGTACVAGVVLTAAGLVLASARPLQALAPLGWGGLLCTGVWALWWAPTIELTPRALRVTGAWRTHVIGWAAVEGCRSRWVLVILLPGGRRVTASAAQRSGGLAQSLRSRQEMLARQTGGARPDEGASAGVREDLLSGAGVRRLHLDAASAAQLVMAYRDELTVRGQGGAGRDGEGERAEAGDVVSTLRWEPVVAAVLFGVIAGASLL